MDRPKPLTDWFVINVEEPGTYGDGRGGFGLSLYVQARKDGGVSKSFVQRVRINGKPRNRGLGPYPEVSLKDARTMARENARKVRRFRVRSSLDSLLSGPIDRPAPVFASAPSIGIRFRDAAEAVIQINRAAWKPGGQSEQQWRYSLETYAFPFIGDKLVSAIMSSDVMDVLTPIWNTKRETAGRVRQRLGAIMDWAIAQGQRTDNPVSSTNAALPKNGGKVKHHAALPWADVPAALVKVHESTSGPAAKLAFEFLTLTALRSGEVRLATWDDFDMKTALLTIPAERMKTGREHRVPLSKQAIRCVLDASDIPSNNRPMYIFQGSTGKPLSDMALTMILRRLKIPATVHGMRSSFRDWAAEEKSDVPGEIAELALAHVDGSSVENAYRRTDFFKHRHELMQAWADYVKPLKPLI